MSHCTSTWTPIYGKINLYSMKNNLSGFSKRTWSAECIYFRSIRGGQEGARCLLESPAIVFFLVIVVFQLFLLAWFWNPSRQWIIVLLNGSEDPGLILLVNLQFCQLNLNIFLDSVPVGLSVNSLDVFYWRMWLVCASSHVFRFISPKVIWALWNG